MTVATFLFAFYMNRFLLILNWFAIYRISCLVVS
mgnify:CR=1 FL=1